MARHTSSGRLARVDVANNNHVNVELIFSARRKWLAKNYDRISNSEGYDPTYGAMVALFFRVRI